MLGWGRLGILLAVSAGSLLVWQPARGQVRAPAPKPPKRCEEHAAPRPGRKIYLDQVTFAGESVPPGVDEDKVAGLLKERALASGRHWLAQVGSAVRESWRDQGYFQAVLRVQRHVIRSSATELHVALRILVDSGPQYRVGEVHIRTTNPGGKLVFPEQRLREMIGLYPGEILDVGKERAGLADIRQLYASRGYIDFAAVPGYQIVNATDRITLSFLLDQGKQYRVGSVKILGLDPYLEPLLRAEVAPGKVFDWSQVVDFYRNQQRGLAPGVSPKDDQISRDAKTGRVNLVLDFRACPGTPVRSSARGD